MKLTQLTPADLASMAEPLRRIAANFAAAQRAGQQWTEARRKAEAR